MSANRMLWVVGALVVTGMALLLPVLMFAGANPVVVIETSMGDITVELYQGQAPITVKNFLHYTSEKWYDGTVFHRVIPGFMIQGGGWEAGELGLREKKTRFPPIKSEANNGVLNKKGTIAMARTKDPDSASSEFFINVADNEDLDHDESRGRPGYTVFGRVTEGMDVAEKIAKVRTGIDESGLKDVPERAITIKSVRQIR